MIEKLSTYKANQVLSTGGIIFGLSLMDLYTLLSIIFVSINLCILVFTLIRNLRVRLKDGKLDENEKQDTAMEILKLRETIKELSEKAKELENKEDK